MADLFQQSPAPPPVQFHITVSVVVMVVRGDDAAAAAAAAACGCRCRCRPVLITNAMAIAVATAIGNSISSTTTGLQPPLFAYFCIPFVCLSHFVSAGEYGVQCTRTSHAARKLCLLQPDQVIIVMMVVMEVEL